uniref:Internal virion protein n=1 Tax=viral metagenome TaxID=1070528 RepID=A0A6M3KEB4_9ZZZZ
MGFATAALLTLAAVQGYTSIASGKAQKKEADYNASLLEQSAGQFDVQSALIEKQKGLDLYQANRQIGQVMGTTKANIAKSGITMSGSPMAVMLDTYTQMEIDKRVNQSNLDMQKYNVGIEKSRTLSQAEAYRRQGKSAVFAGYTNAFTSALSVGVNYGIYTGAFNQKAPQRAGKL